MNDLLALAKAVRENPFDRAAHLVLADYLEETGKDDAARLYRRIAKVIWQKGRHFVLWDSDAHAFMSQLRQKFYYHQDRFTVRLAGYAPDPAMTNPAIPMRHARYRLVTGHIEWITHPAEPVNHPVTRRLSVVRCHLYRDGNIFHPAYLEVFMTPFDYVVFVEGYKGEESK